MISYCSAAAEYSEAQVLSSDFWSDVKYAEGNGVNGLRYAQRMCSALSPFFADEDETVTGCIRPETLDRIRPDDAGGQYDSSGGTNGEGNPAGSVCRGYVVIFCSEGSF